MLKLFYFSLFICGLLLSIHSAWLLLDGKIHLGTILPFIIGILLCCYAVFYQSIHDFLQQHYALNLLFNITIIGFMLWLLSVMIFAVYLAQHIAPTQLKAPVHAIIVLGSGIQADQPAPTLKQRLDTAAQIAQQQKQSIVVLTGGLGFGEKWTEADVGARYLQQHYHLSTQRLLLEDRSTSTELNLANSAPLMQKKGITLNLPIAIVTSDFHTVRAAAIAKKLGYQQVYMISAETPLNIRYNAWLREYFAFVSGWLLREY